MEDFKAVIFTVNQEDYGLDINDVISIERMQSFTAIPSSSAYIRGIITIRGIVTPIIDLRMALGHVKSTDTDSTRIIVIDRKEHPIGLIVDGAKDVLDISSDSIQQISIMSEIDFIQGISKMNDRLLILINIHKMLQNMDGLDDLKNLNINQLKNEAFIK